MKTQWQTIILLFIIFIAAGCVSEADKDQQESVVKNGELLKSLDTLPPLKSSQQPLQQEVSNIDPLEKSQWDKATNPLSIAEIQKYLEKYPSGNYAIEAKQIIDDEKVIEEIETNGVGSRFVVPPDLLPEFVVAGSTYNQQRGRTVFQEIAPGVLGAKTVFGNISYSIPTFVTNPQELQTRGFRGPFAPCADRSIFVMGATVENIVGDPQNPIRFVYSVSKGLVYIGGEGKVLNHSGEVIFQAP